MRHDLTLHKSEVNMFRKFKGWEYTFLVGRHMAAWWEHGKTVSSAFTELLTLGRTNGAKESKLLFNYRTTQISSCGMCEEIFLDMESECKQVCGRCDQAHELLSLVAEGQDDMRVWGIHWNHTLISMMHRSQLSVATAGSGLEPGLYQKQGNTTRDNEDW